MAWNGSKAAQGKVGTGPTKPNKIRPKMGSVPILLWLGAGILAAVFLFLCIRSDDSEPPKAPAARTKETPQKAQGMAKTGDEPAEAKPEDDGEWHPPKDAYKDERGIWRYPGGMRVYDPTRPRKTTNLRMEGDRPSIFRYRAEKEIERLLTMEPGRPMFGTRRYDVNFEKDYLESLKEPIIITKDDSDEDRALKQMMIDTKIEIADRMRNGETLKDILEGARNELQRMAEYKRSLQLMMAKDVKDGMSEQDLDDYIKAANIMLEQNGIAPLRNTSILKRNIRLNTKGSRQ